MKKTKYIVIIMLILAGIIIMDYVVKDKTVIDTEEVGTVAPTEEKYYPPVQTTPPQKQGSKMYKLDITGTAVMNDYVSPTGTRYDYGFTINIKNLEKSEICSAYLLPLKATECLHQS